MSEKEYQEIKFNRNIKVFIDNKKVENIEEVTLTIVCDIDKETKQVIKDRATIHITKQT